MTYLDLAAGAIELAGKWVTGNKNRWGHALNLLCCILWIAYVITSGTTYGILLIVVPAMFINVRNFIKWTKDDNGAEPTAGVETCPYDLSNAAHPAQRILRKTTDRSANEG
jgi:hypothetical protein